MIIDIHGHIGTGIPHHQFYMPEDMLINSLNKYNIDFIICSNIKGSEVTPDQEESDLLNFHQTQVNQEMIDIAKRHPDKVGAALWIMPRKFGINADFIKLIEQNSDCIYALKVHPYLSSIAFDDSRILDYIEVAKTFNLPVVTHTAGTYESSSSLVYKVSKLYKDVNFVLYHMDLGTNNEQAIKYIKERDNLFGDTSWVRPESVLKAIKTCGSEKIMFGTDNPINGADTYDDDNFYNYSFNTLPKQISRVEHENYMYKNAQRLFNIEI